MYVFIIASNDKIHHAMTFDYDSLEECAEEMINNWDEYAAYWEGRDGNLTNILFDALNNNDQEEQQIINDEDHEVITYRDITEEEYEEFIDSITPEMLIMAIYNSKNHMPNQDFYKLTKSVRHRP